MSKKLKFGYDLTGLSTYVNEEKLPLLMKSVFGGETFNTFEIQDGIKYKEKLNYLETEVLFRANEGCSTFTASGATTLTQREIQVYPIISEQAWCPDDVEQYWAKIGLAKGCYYDTIAFEKEWNDDYTKQVAKQFELMVWQGEIGVGSGNLGLIDGFITVIDGEADVVDGNTTGGGYTAIASGTGITTSNVITILEHQIEVLPVDVEGAEDMIICVGWDTFKKLLSALKTLNNFFYDGVNANPYKSGEVYLPTYGVLVKAFRGLDSTNRIFTGRKSNFVIGTDMQNDWEQYQMWYEQKDDKVLHRLKAKLGVQIKFPEEMVQFTLTA